MKGELTAPRSLGETTIRTNIDPILVGSDACHNQLKLRWRREFLSPDKKEQQLPKDLPITWMILLEELAYVLQHGVHVHPLHCTAVVLVVGLQLRPIATHLLNNLCGRDWSSILANTTSNEMPLIFPVFRDNRPPLKSLWKRLTDDGPSHSVAARHVKESGEGIFVLLGSHVVEVLENWSIRMAKPLPFYTPLVHKI